MENLDHPLIGLLLSSLKKNYTLYLRQIIPEDFCQECRLFLLENGASPDKLNVIEFRRAASRHFYRVAINYGLGRRFGFRSRQEVSVSQWQREGEEYDESRNEIFSIDPRPEQERQLWRSETLQYCRKILSSGNGLKNADLCIFEKYIIGNSPKEIADSTGKSSKAVAKRLFKMVDLIRKSAKVDSDFPLPTGIKKIKLMPGRKKGNNKIKSESTVERRRLNRVLKELVNTFSEDAIKTIESIFARN